MHNPVDLNFGPWATTLRTAAPDMASAYLAVLNEIASLVQLPPGASVTDDLLPAVRRAIQAKALVHYGAVDHAHYKTRSG